MSIENATPRLWTVINRFGAVNYIADVNNIHFAAITGTPEVVSDMLNAVNQHEPLLDALRAIRDLTHGLFSIELRAKNMGAIRSIATEALKAAGDGS